MERNFDQEPKRDILEKSKDWFGETLKNKQKAGKLTMILLFGLLISQVALPFMANPIFLLMNATLIPLLGDIGTLLLITTSFIFTLIYFFDFKKLSSFKTHPVKKLFLLFGIILFIASIVLPLADKVNHFGYTSIADIYTASGFDLVYVARWTDGWTAYNAISFQFHGLAIPAVYYFTGGIITFLIPMFIALGAIAYSLIYGFFNKNVKEVFILATGALAIKADKLEDKELGEIKTVKGQSDIDLNQDTQEFTVALGESWESKNAIDEVSSKVKETVREQNKTTLLADVQYGKEKERLEALKLELIERRANEPEKPNFEDPNSPEEVRKREALLNLGFISPTMGDVRTKEVTDELSITEEELNNELTSESLTDLVETDIADEILAQAGDPTEEIPSLELYADQIFEQDLENVLSEATEEFNITIGESSEVESTKEVIIENIEEHIAFKETLIEDNKYDDISPEVTEEEDLRDLKETVTDYKSATVEEEVSVEEETVHEDTFEMEVPEEHEHEDDHITENVIHDAPAEDVRKNITEKEEDKGQLEEDPNWGKDFKMPSISILSDAQKIDTNLLQNEAQFKQQKLNELFENFGVGAQVKEYEVGPTVTIFKVAIEPGTKITKVTNLEDNIKLNLSAKEVRIQSPIPGTTFIGIEVPNTTRIPVGFKETFIQTQNEKASLLITLGQDVFGRGLSFDLAKAPHVLIAGSTGSGKSVAINTVLASLILRYAPTDLKMILIDPKMVEFTPFHNIPHLITPVITSASDANLALKSAVNEMEDRYKAMAEAGARNIIELNQINEKKGVKKMPYIVVIIDELADLMMVASKDVEDSIRRITQKARAAGIHMIVATQRPSTDIITGVIKSNIPSRIAFTVASSIDSRTILDASGAEKLVGLGDMMVSLYGQMPYRGQGAYISIEDVQAITDYAKQQYNPVYSIDIQAANAQAAAGGAMIDESDPLYQSALKIVVQQQKASTSLLQRYLSIGYNKAANLVDALEANGVIGPTNGSKPRDVLIDDE